MRRLTPAPDVYPKDQRYTNTDIQDFVILNIGGTVYPFPLQYEIGPRPDCAPQGVRIKLHRCDRLDRPRRLVGAGHVVALRSEGGGRHGCPCATRARG